MKILFFGTHIKHYYLAKWLRERGHECFIYQNIYKERNMPEAYDKKMQNNYPAWIGIPKFDYNSKFRRFLRFISRCPLNPMIFQYVLNILEISLGTRIKRLEKKYDIIFTSGSENIIKATKFKKPVVFRALGSDLTKFPFNTKNNQKLFLSYYLKKRIRKISKYIIYQEDTYWATRFLGIQDKIEFYSIPIDIKEMNENFNIELYNIIKKKYVDYDYVFFMPARKNINPISTSYKGLDKVIKAIAANKKYLKKFKCIATENGLQVDEFKELIEIYSLKDYFEFIKPQPIYNLCAYLKQDNFIVINDVGYKKYHLTGIGRESISMGAILIDSIDTQNSMFKKIYADEPLDVLSAYTYKDLCDRIIYLTNLSVKQKMIMKQNISNWALRNLDWRYRIEELEIILKKVVKS